MGFILFLISIIISIGLYPIAFFYMLIKFIVQFKFLKILKSFDKIFYKIAYSIDQLGNVVLGELMNDAILKNKYYCHPPIMYIEPAIHVNLIVSENRIKVNRFGNPDQTISSCLGHNLNIDNIKNGWSWLPKLLDFLDKNHCIKAALEDQYIK